MKKLSFLVIAVAASLCVNATDLKGLKIYINPGHGGHDSDDRNVVVPPFTGGDPEGYWESKTLRAIGSRTATCRKDCRCAICWKISVLK